VTNNLILVGFMGTGKTDVGRALARRLGWEFMDSDDIVEERSGKTISEIFREEGEERFREIESQVARDLPKLSNHVIATGGGIVLREDNLTSLRKAGKVICLKASPEEIVKRLENTGDRPLLDTPERINRIKRFLTERRSFYEQADFIIDTTGMTVKAVVDRVIEILEC